MTGKAGDSTVRPFGQTGCRAFIPSVVMVTMSWYKRLALSLGEITPSARNDEHLCVHSVRLAWHLANQSGVN